MAAPHPLPRVDIDGAAGEGGGQVLRTALACAALTRRAVRITRIRAGRPNPGLGRQHLVAVQAAAAVSGAALRGAALGSTELDFSPGAHLRGGAYDFDIGSAGSTTLVLQALLPILLHADGPSTVVVRGGTHNPMAPPFEFLDESLLPVLRGLGARVALRLSAAGFYPAGGGRVDVDVHPLPPAPSALSLLARGDAVAGGPELTIVSCRGDAGVLAQQAAALSAGVPGAGPVSRRAVDGRGPGNAVVATLRYAAVTDVVVAIAERPKPAAALAAAAAVAAAVRAHRATTAPVGEHLADQLLLPLAVMGGGTFRTSAPLSLHFTTNADVLAAFFGPCVSTRPAVAADGGDGVVVSVSAVTLQDGAGVAAGGEVGAGDAAGAPPATAVATAAPMAGAGTS